MRTYLKSIILLIFMSTGYLALNAQENDKYLPVSTKSEEAKAALNDALKSIHNADTPGYQEKMNEAIEADPNFFMAHAYLALGEESHQEGDKNNAHIEQALALPQDQLTPAEQTVRAILVSLKDDRKREVKSLLEKLVSAYPNTPQAYEMASDVSRFILGDQKNGMAYVKKLVEIEPEHASAYNTLGYYYLETKEMDKAKEAFEKYLSLAPDEPNAYDSMGDYYMAAGDFNKSAEHFNKAVALGMDASKAKADKATAMAADDETDAPTIDEPKED